MNMPSEASSALQGSTTGASRSILFQSMEDVESRQAGQSWVEKHKRELVIDHKGQPKVVKQNTGGLNT